LQNPFQRNIPAGGQRTMVRNGALPLPSSTPRSASTTAA
jgi:hypothetical protein